MSTILEDLNRGIAAVWEASQRYEHGWSVEMDLSRVPRRTLRRLYPNRSRRSRRTDFARPGRLRFFSRGRSYPTKRLSVVCDIFELSVGQVTTDHGVILAIDIPTRTAWVSA